MAIIKDMLFGKHWDDGTTSWDGQSTVWNIWQTGEIGKLAKKGIIRRAQNGIETARFTTKSIRKHSAEFIQVTAKHHEALHGWQALSGWKKYRWSLCAWKKGLAEKPPEGWIGWSGMTLYFAERVRQNTPANKQPISPCSRRATNPSADPSDYTP